MGDCYRLEASEYRDDDRRTTRELMDEVAKDRYALMGGECREFDQGMKGMGYRNSRLGLNNDVQLSRAR